MKSVNVITTTPLSSRTPPSHDKRGEGAKKKLFEKSTLEPRILSFEDSTINLSSSASTIDLSSSAFSWSSSPFQETMDEFYPSWRESTPIPQQPPPQQPLPQQLQLQQPPPPPLAAFLPPEVEAIIGHNPAGYQIVVTQTVYTLTPL